MGVVPDLSSRPFNLSIERDFPLPPSELYAAWTERFDLWFAMPGSVSMRAEVDEPFFFVTEYGHAQHPHYGRFLRLEQDRLVELTWVTGAAGTKGAETVVTVNLQPTEKGTHLQLTHAGFLDEESKQQHAMAWPVVLDQQELRLKGGDPAAESNSTTEIVEGGFVVRTVFDATPQHLYEAWTVREDVNGWLATDSEIDAAVGGKYVYRWPLPDGEYSAKGEYLELEPGKKIVQTWESWGPTGRFEGMDVTLTIEFDDLGDGKAAMTQTEISPVYADPDRARDSMGGGIEAHKGLARFLASKKAG